MAEDRHTVLIVYYSETGNTRAVADALDKALDATVERISAPLFDDHRSFWLFSWRLVTALVGGAAKVAPPQHDPAGFDLVVLASPVWGGRLSTPMRGYLKDFRGRFRNVAYVSTQTGEHPGRIFTDFAQILHKHGIARLSVSEPDRRSHHDTKKIADFAADLRAAMQPDPIPR
ncbi:MAG: hypothetical protein VW644_07925 [Alphaproteobacteria bacterium]|jgi:hypothetical protein